MYYVFNTVTVSGNYIIKQVNNATCRLKAYFVIEIFIQHVIAVLWLT